MCHVNITRDVVLSAKDTRGLCADDWNQCGCLFSHIETQSSLRSAALVCVGPGDPPQVCSPSQRRLCALFCILILHSAFPSPHWLREDAPGALPSQTPPASKMLKGEERFGAQTAPPPAARRGAETGRGRGQPAPAEVSGGVPDFDEEQQRRQEGGVIEKHVWRGRY